jgi:DNA-binding response OmpR family regulator
MGEDKVYRALVLDDEPVAAELLRDYLVEYDFDVTTFSESREAFEHLEEEDQEYDVLVFDINLPGIDGITLASRLRRSLSLNIPVLFVSAHISDDRRKKIQRMGDGYGYLEKGSFKAQDLFEKANALITKSRVHVELGALKRDLRVGLSSIHSKLEAFTPEAVLTAIDPKFADQAAKCAGSFEEVLEKKTSPRAISEAFNKDVLFRLFKWAIFLVLSGYGAWLLATHQMTTSNKAKLIEVQSMQGHIRETIEPLKALPSDMAVQRAEMKAQGQKIDAVLKHVKLNGRRRGGNP